MAVEGLPAVFTALCTAVFLVCGISNKVDGRVLHKEAMLAYILETGLWCAMSRKTDLLCSAVSLLFLAVQFVWDSISSVHATPW